MDSKKVSMRHKTRKTIIIGIDGASAKTVKAAIAQGEMPNLKRILERGIYADALPVIPTHTPTNWTTIGTGAWPGTHGITGFSVHHRGEPLSVLHSGWDTREVTAEFLWQAAERVGKKSILLKWCGPTFPVTVKKGIQVDGCFCFFCSHQISGPTLFSTADEPFTTRAALKQAKKWKNVPGTSLNPLEAELTLGSSDFTTNLNLLILNSRGKGYDKIEVCTGKDLQKRVATFSVGEWTEWLYLSFEGKSSQIGTMRLKLIELSEDAARLKIYCSQIMPMVGWAFPESVSRDLVENVGPFIQSPGYKEEERIYGAWAGHETLMEEIAYQEKWYARAATYLMKNYPWDILFFQTHTPDIIFDNLLSEAEPLTAPNAEHSRKYQKLIWEMYKMVDKTIGTIAESADKDTLLIVVSDHGVVGSHSTRHVNEIVSQILVEEGLLFCQSLAVQSGNKPRMGTDIIDWSRTKAFFLDSCHLYLNVKGREPNGVIEPEEYEKIRNRIIQRLISYKDPRLEMCPFSLILKSEEAKIIGLYGDRIGDIIVMVRPGGLYGEGHGHYLPTAEYGMSSITGVLFMAGPGLKKSYELERPVWLVDVAPTIAYLMEIPAPRQAEGKILYEAFTD